MRQLHISFEIRAMGLLFYIPLVLPLLVVAGMFLNQIQGLYAILQIVEYLLPPWVSLWCIQLLRNHMEFEGCEVLHSYPLSKWKSGVGMMFLFWVFYLLWIITLISVLQVMIPVHSFFGSFVLQTGFQSLFYACFGFMLITLTRNAFWALGIVLFYASTQILTKGNLAPWVNIYLFHNETIPSFPDLQPKMLQAFVLSFICILVGQIRYFRTERF